MSTGSVTVQKYCTTKSTRLYESCLALQLTEDVAQGFEHAGEGEGEGEEVVGAVAGDLGDVKQEGEEEEDDSEDAEGEGGDVGVDDDVGVVGVVGVGEGGGDVAAC